MKLLPVNNLKNQESKVNAEILRRSSVQTVLAACAAHINAPKDVVEHLRGVKLIHLMWHWWARGPWHGRIGLKALSGAF